MAELTTIQRFFRHRTYELMDELSYRLKTGTRSVEYQDISTADLWDYVKNLREDTILCADTK